MEFAKKLLHEYRFMPPKSTKQKYIFKKNHHQLIVSQEQLAHHLNM
jgi:hypothetical protein